VVEMLEGEKDEEMMRPSTHVDELLYFCFLAVILEHFF
jgi:hypothetical protein